MQSTTRTAAIALGVYAGILGAVHGIFEILQGTAATDGLLVYAIGAPCNPEQVWHACLPALTVTNNFRAAGILALLFSGLTLYNTLFPDPRRRLAVFMPAVMMLLVGAGFVPAYLAVLSGVAMSQVDRSRKDVEANPVMEFLSGGWPGILFLFIAWSAAAWVVGAFFNELLLSLGFALFLIGDVLLPLLTLLSAIAAERATAVV